MQKYQREVKRHGSQMRNSHIWSEEVSEENREIMVERLSIKKMAGNFPEVINAPALRVKI